MSLHAILSCIPSHLPHLCSSCFPVHMHISHHTGMRAKWMYPRGTMRRYMSMDMLYRVTPQHLQVSPHTMSSVPSYKSTKHATCIPTPTQHGVLMARLHRVAW